MGTLADMRFNFQPLLSVTVVLIVLNCFWWVGSVLFDPQAILIPTTKGLVDWGANIGLESMTGQWWRLLSSAFVHSGILHLAINVFALWSIGPLAEKIFGWRAFLLVYIVTAVVGSLCSVAMNPTLISCGASAATFGIYAAVVARGGMGKQNMPVAMFVAFMIASVIYGMFVPGIDNAAHVGGAACGFLLGKMLRSAVIGWAAILATLVSLVVAGTAATVGFEIGDYRSYREAIKLTQADRFTEAIPLLEHTIRVNPKNVDAYIVRGFAHMKMHDLAKAKDDFGQAIEAQPKRADVYNSRAWAECGLREYEVAINDATSSIQLNPRAAATYDTRGVAYAGSGKQAEALEDYAKAIKLQPHDPAAYYHRASLLYARNENEKADADMRKGIKYKPEFWEESAITKAVPGCSVGTPSLPSP